MWYFCFCDMLFKGFFFSAVIQFFVQNIRRNELWKNKGTFSLPLSNLECSLVDGLALSLYLKYRNAEYFACVYVCLCVCKKISLSAQRISWVVFCFLSLSRARAFSLSIAQSVIKCYRVFFILFLFKSNLHWML